MAKIYFSDFFGISAETLEEHGAFNISVMQDLPLFIDPFLLFNSEDLTYKALHGDIIRYMVFLKDTTLSGSLTPGLIQGWFAFPEVKQNWLGYSKQGNSGRGLGAKFAQSLHDNFRIIFRDFGTETLTRSSHLEKLCLVRRGVGRDNLSDFTTNLIKPFLAEYSQDFALRYLPLGSRRRVSVPKVRFNYETRSWSPVTYELPYINGDYVLLTPKNILTKDEAWINRPELIASFVDIADSLPNAVLRDQVNDYLRRVLPKEPDSSKEEVQEAILKTIEAFPAVLDYYILHKENDGHKAVSVSAEKVREAESRFVEGIQQFVSEHLEPGGFYRRAGNSYTEARERLMFLKDVIENKGGHRIFYVDGKPLEREADLQILYRLTWYATPSDISREVNDGRGPVDFKASRGASDKTLIEFKLASNSKLERNLEKQTKVYEKASNPTHPSLTAILYFTDTQLQRVSAILRRLELQTSNNIVLVDARGDNKPSGSKA